MTKIFLIITFLLTTQFVMSVESTSKKKQSKEPKNVVEVMEPWVRFLPGKMATGAFMKIKNPTEFEIELVKAESDSANIVELHDHINDNGLMKMSKIEGIKIPSHAAVELKKGSLHIMLIDLKKPLIEGQKVYINLIFKNGQKQRISAEVLKK